MKQIILIVIVTVGAVCNSFSQIAYPGNSPGIALSKIQNESNLILENDLLKASFLSLKGKISLQSFEDKVTREKLNFNETFLFEVFLPDIGNITSNDFKLMHFPVIEDIKSDSKALTYAKKLSGKKISADLKHKKSGLNVHWEAQLRDGSNYVRQIFTFSSNDTIRVSQITLFKFPLEAGFSKEGTVDGLPLVYKNMFIAIEHPLSKNEHINNNYRSTLPIARPITLSSPLAVPSVIGTTPVGQLRRGFLYYMERERTSPYHQMLHYNSWSDIAWKDRKMNERVCLSRIQMIGDSLVIKRGIQMDAFLFDDGWDDNKTLWKFHAGFPEGFANLKTEVEKYGTTLGVWISPFGGYGEAKEQRLEFGKNQTPPFETNKNGFSLSGPVYYDRFKTVLTNFIKEYDISMLKFDGVGAGFLAKGASSYHEDMEAFLKVTNELRDVKLDLYFLLTTGTWPSPFFLKYGDIIWRGGADYGFLGEGSRRQQWITFRDADIFKNVVQRSPLYPLNALQCMGFYASDVGEPGEFEMDEKSVSDDIWMGFGTGTSVQGLYINPNRMNTEAWDCLANAITWSKENEKVMTDMHWVGGDPAKGEVYGYAAWSQQKAVLILRNPSSEAKMFNVSVPSVLDLPEGTEHNYLFYDAKRDANQPIFQGSSFEITLQPFEVKVFDAFPKKD